MSNLKEIEEKFVHFLKEQRIVKLNKLELKNIEKIIEKIEEKVKELLKEQRIQKFKKIANDQNIKLIKESKEFILVAISISGKKIK